MNERGNNSSQSNDALLEELSKFSRSASISEDGLRGIIERHGAAPNNNDDPNIDYKFFRAACRNKKVTEGILRYLLEYFPNAAKNEDEGGNLPLHLICGSTNVTLGMVQLLIGAFPESLHREDNHGLMPLHKLCFNKNLSEEARLGILKLLVEKCPEAVKHATRFDNLPIHYAAARQSLDFCRILIEAYPGSERMTSGKWNGGWLPFHFACQCNTVATVKYLYQLYPESINVADNYGSQPIHHAITGLKNRSNPQDGIAMVAFLLECNPGALSSTGRTPLHIACGNKNVTLNIVQLLIGAFPDSVRHQDNQGFIPLHTLCLNNNLDEDDGLEILKFLLERCPESIRHATRDGGLPIHIAAGYQSPEFCRVLIQAYPGSEQIAQGNGLLPFHYACGNNTVATAKYLYELYPESINVANNNGVYPIHYVMLGIKHKEYSPEFAVETLLFLLDCEPNVVSQKLRDKLPLYWVCIWATNEDTPRLNAALKVLQILYDAHPEAIDEVTSNVGEICAEMQTFINTQLTYARHAADGTLMTTRDENGQLPLHKALLGDKNAIFGSIKLLVKGNSSAVQSPDNGGALPLHLACQHHESASVVEYLVGLDSDTLTIVDRDGNTALHHACRGAKYDTIALLLDKYGGISVSRRNSHNQLPVHLLLESPGVIDREDTKYVESIYRLLRAYPETVMMCEKEESNPEDCLSYSGKKRKFGTE